MSINMNVSFNDTASRQIAQLPKMVQDNILRSTARAGALVFYDLMHANAPYKEGKILNAIYHKFIGEQETPKYKAYRIAVNHKKAPHWHLLEYGHMMYYQVKKKPNGEYVTLVRPDKIGTPKPSRWASREVKDQYYIPLKGGPKHIPGRAYIRRSFEEGQQMAENAAIRRASEKFNEMMSNPNMVRPDVD